MKQYIATVMLCISLMAVMPLFAQHAFTLKGKVTNEQLEGERVTLSYKEGKKRTVDTTRIKNGMFEFKGSVTEPLKAGISTKKIIVKDGAPDMFPFNRQDFFIDGGAIQLEGFNIATAVIKGGRSQAALNKLKAQLKPGLDNDRQALMAIVHARETHDSVAMQAAKNRLTVNKAAADSIEVAFIFANPASFVSLDLVSDRMNPTELANNSETLKKMYNNLNPGLKSTAIGEEIKSKIEFAGKLAVGMPSIDFTMNDTLGKPVSLSSFRGKYVLLDFWASWCIPCRAENPSVIKAYEKFKDKNFTVLAVSLDKPDGKQAWIDAIHKDKLTWTHVSDLKFGDNAAAKTYGVYSIPMNFLIDPDGTIVGLSLRGEALSKKLEEILNR